MTKVCVSCREAHVRPLLDFGPVPLTNRYRSAAETLAPAETFRLKLGQCGRCGLVQLIGPPSAATVRAKVPWIAYQEPESHLDDLVERLLNLPGMGKRAVAVGLSSKDDSTLRRLRARGVGNVWRIDPAGDLGVDEPCSGLESVAERIDVDTVARIVEAAGPADIVIARHLLEHVADLPRFVAAVKRLVRPEGYVVWEVPDCARSMELGDYTMPWEEHMAYFTAATLRLTLEAAGFEIESLSAYPYARENSLLAICRIGAIGRIAAAPRELLEAEVVRANSYADAFGPRQAKCEEYVSRIIDEHGKIAIFGGGHASVMFLQLMRLTPYVGVCFDDDPNKQGLMVPGTTIPIRSSNELATSDSRLCLLGIGPDAQRRVIEKHPGFAANGGRFASIFPADTDSFAALIRC
jgi:hypothetical protein